MGWACGVQANLIIAINNTGANDPVSIDSPRAWNFGVTAAGASFFQTNGITFDSALFDAKVHKDTVAPLVFTLYKGLGGNVAGNTSIATVSLGANKFTQKYSDGAGSLFTFTPEMLTAGYYSATLTSIAANGATTEYFLKQGTLSLLDSNMKALDSSYWVQDSGTGHATTTFSGPALDNGGGGGGLVLAPEPNAVLAMLMVGGLSIGGSLVQRIRKSA